MVSLTDPSVHLALQRGIRSGRCSPAWLIVVLLAMAGWSSTGGGGGCLSGSAKEQLRNTHGGLLIIITSAMSKHHHWRCRGRRLRFGGVDGRHGLLESQCTVVTLVSAQ